MSGQSDPARMIQVAVPQWMADPGLSNLVRLLEEAGGSPRFVGGCVRDQLLGRPVRDIDLATVLEPEMVQHLLQNAGVKVVPTGLSHGTVTAVLPSLSIEVTTLRRDIETDGRHALVAYTQDWQADASRRDFTMNALFLTPEGGLVDFFDGLADAKAGRVRFVGDPDRRITEDYLRILRFFRFHAHYGRGAADPSALNACRSHAESLESLSGERLAKEFFRLLEAADPASTVLLMEEAGCLHPFSVSPFGVERLAALPADSQRDVILRFMALSSDDPDIVEATVLRLKLSNAMAERMRARLSGYFAGGPPVAEQLYRNGAQAVLDSARIQKAGGGDAPKLAEVISAAERWHEPVFPLKGQDLLALGLEPGPEIGEILASVESWWVKERFSPDREACLGRARTLV